MCQLYTKEHKPWYKKNNVCTYSYYTYCSSHRLNLVCKSLAQSKALLGSLSIVNYIGVLFSKSGQFSNLYQSIDNDKTRFK